MAKNSEEKTEPDDKGKKGKNEDPPYFRGHVTEIIAGSKRFEFTVSIGGEKPESHKFFIDPQSEDSKEMKKDVKKAYDNDPKASLGVYYAKLTDPLTKADEVIVIWSKPSN